MIKPTVGRVVWFRPSLNAAAEGGFTYHNNGQPLAAIVAYVWGDRMVNLAVFDSNGVLHSKTSVPLVQDGDEPSPDGYYCEWMPYQKGQAAKTEQLEQKLTAS